MKEKIEGLSESVFVFVVAMASVILFDSRRSTLLDLSMAGDCVKLRRESMV